MLDRELDSMEQGMELFNRFAHSLNIVVISKIRGSLDASVVRKSLDLAQKLHPNLRSHIVGDINRLQFMVEGTKEVPLQVLHADSEKLISIVEKELNQKIESKKVLARAVLVKSISDDSLSYLITTIHHAIADALCGVNLHKNILELCHRILSETNPQVSTMEALPPLQFFVDKCLVEGVGSQPTLKNSTNSISRLQALTLVPHSDRTCKIFQRKLDTDSSLNLMAICKEKGVTVHGVICAAMMFSLKNLIQVDSQELYFSCRSSVDMRRRIKPSISNEYLSMLVSALTSIHGLTNETTFWDLASSVTEQIKQRLETSEVYSGVVNYRKGAENLLRNPELMPFSIFVTNIGKIDIPKIYGSLLLEDISYALSITVMGSIFGTAVSTFSDQITFNFIFTHPLVDQETINFLIDKTITILINI